MAVGAGTIRAQQLERNLFELEEIPEKWHRERTPCPTCGKHETLELLRYTEELWKQRAHAKAVEINMGAHDWDVFLRSLGKYDGYTNRPGERCVGCGTVYDPFVKHRTEIVKQNIEALKACALHPLERLAEESK